MAMLLRNLHWFAIDRKVHGFRAEIQRGPWFSENGPRQLAVENPPSFINFRFQSRYVSIFDFKAGMLHLFNMILIQTKIIMGIVVLLSLKFKEKLSMNKPSTQNNPAIPSKHLKIY